MHSFCSTSQQFTECYSLNEVIDYNSNFPHDEDDIPAWSMSYCCGAGTVGAVLESSSVNISSGVGCIMF